MPTTEPFGGPRVTGPDPLPCRLECDVPEGVTLAEVPMPRHAWTDIIICPNKDCGRAWMVVQKDSHG